MSSFELIREHLKSSLPPGEFWTARNDYSDLIDALAESLAPWYDQAVLTSCIRDPADSLRIDDLADEYGAEIFSTLTDDQIIALVQLAKRGVKEPGSGDLENALNSAGFDVQVHRNGPTATNPANFIGDEIELTVADNEDSVADNENAIVGSFGGGDLLINGLIKATVAVVLSGADVDFMVADNELAIADYFEQVEEAEFGYELPEEQDRWPNVYFIGGDAERTIDGELLNIDYVDIPVEQQNEFENLILRYAPAQGWCGLFINYI